MLDIVTPPYAEPLDIAEARLHVRQDAAVDDLYLGRLIRAARRRVEEACNKQMVTATYRLSHDHFPGLVPPGYGHRRIFKLPRPPCQVVTGITYVDTAGNPQTLDPSQYQVDNLSPRAPARIMPAYGLFWPVTRWQLNAVQVTYVTGHATPFTVNTSTSVCTPLGLNWANGRVLRLSNSGGALPTPLAVNTDYFVVNATATTFQLAATSGGSPLAFSDAGSGTSYVGVVPEALTQAMLLLIGNWYEFREPANKAQLAKLPYGVDDLVASEWTGEYGGTYEGPYPWGGM